MILENFTIREPDYAKLKMMMVFVVDEGFVEASLINAFHGFFLQDPTGRKKLMLIKLKTLRP